MVKYFPIFGNLRLETFLKVVSICVNHTFKVIFTKLEYVPTIPPLSSYVININTAKKVAKKLICGTWNICRGLISREHELTQLLKDESIDILFLTETDTRLLEIEKDYSINGFKTIFPLRSSSKDKIRIICLLREELAGDFQILKSSMNCKFPSIWLEKTKKENNSEVNSLAIGGFYREWSHNGANSEVSQLNRMDILSEQIEQVTSKYQDV